MSVGLNFLLHQKNRGQHNMMHSDIDDNTKFFSSYIFGPKVIAGRFSVMSISILLFMTPCRTIIKKKGDRKRGQIFFNFQFAKCISFSKWVWVT